MKTGGMIGPHPETFSERFNELNNGMMDLFPRISIVGGKTRQTKDLGNGITLSAKLVKAGDIFENIQINCNTLAKTQRINNCLVSMYYTAIALDSEIDRLAFRKDWLLHRGLHEQDLNIVTAKGDSMEPTISSKDTLLVDTSKTNPRDGNIYVIRSGDVLWVKRIQRQVDGNLLLISDNTTYPPMPLMLAEHPDIQVIGQVVQVSKNLY